MLRELNMTYYFELRKWYLTMNRSVFECSYKNINGKQIEEGTKKHNLSASRHFRMGKMYS